MNNGLAERMDRLFNRHGDGRAVCTAADHGYMSDVTPNVVKLRSITEKVIKGGVDGILLSPGQADHLAPMFTGRDGPALIVRADWMNMPRLGSANVTNAVPQRRLFHQKILTARQALALGASAITIYLFLGYDDDVEAAGIDSCSKFANECRAAGLPCIMEPLAYGPHATGANIVEILTLGARICVELGADALKIPYTGDIDSFKHLVDIAQVPVLVLGGARSDNERDALELFAEGLEAGCHGCLMGRNVTKSPDPERLMRQLCQVAHEGYNVDEALRGERWEMVRLKGHSNNCTGCLLCVTACVGAHENNQFGTHQSRLRIETVRLGKHRVMYCTLCKKCIEICPSDALRWHPETGAVEFIAENCTACDECIEICPTQVIFKNGHLENLDSERRHPYLLVCDLCQGDPACANICPEEAISIDNRKVIR
jgi:DhnA family fructose-bisphosphate aldolase class Ia/Fe-S-cluster-containing hydrogenase component 2